MMMMMMMMMMIMIKTTTITIIIIIFYGNYIKLYIYAYCYNASFMMTLKISASDKIQSLENHNYRTHHSTDLARSLFSSLSNSLETQFFICLYFNFLKGFYWKKFFWKIITTVPVIVQT